MKKSHDQEYDQGKDEEQVQQSAEAFEVNFIQTKSDSFKLSETKIG